jgi:hypothetical protein
MKISESEKNAITTKYNPVVENIRYKIYKAENIVIVDMKNFSDDFI